MKPETFIRAYQSSLGLPPRRTAAAVLFFFLVQITGNFDAVASVAVSDESFKESLKESSVNQEASGPSAIPASPAPQAQSQTTIGFLSESSPITPVSPAEVSRQLPAASLPVVIPLPATADNPSVRAAGDTSVNGPPEITVKLSLTTSLNPQLSDTVRITSDTADRVAVNWNSRVAFGVYDPKTNTVSVRLGEEQWTLMFSRKGADDLSPTLLQIQRKNLNPAYKIEYTHRFSADGLLIQTEQKRFLNGGWSYRTVSDYTYIQIGAEKKLESVLQKTSGSGASILTESAVYYGYDTVGRNTGTLTVSRSTVVGSTGSSMFLASLKETDYFAKTRVVLSARGVDLVDKVKSWKDRSIVEDAALSKVVYYFDALSPGGYAQPKWVVTYVRDSQGDLQARSVQSRSNEIGIVRGRADVLSGERDDLVYRPLSQSVMGYSVRFGAYSEAGVSKGMGFVFTKGSSSQAETIFVDFPKQDSIKIAETEYSISLDGTGKLILTQKSNPPSDVKQGPEIQIITDIPALTNKTELTVEYTVDGVRQSQKFSLSKEGSQEIVISEKNSAGYVTEIRRTLVRDTLPPVIEVTSAVPQITNQRQIQIQYQVDGVAKTSNRTLIEGANVLTVTETDAAGNVTTKTFSVTLDSTAPVVAFTSAVLTNKAAYVLTYTVDGVAKTSNRTLIEGANVLTVTETDAAGNVTTKTFSVTLDSTAPVVAFTSAALTNKAAYVLTYTVDGVAKTSNRTLTEGVNVLTVTETDAAGNTATKTFSVTLDSTAPVVAFTSAALTNKAAYVLTYTVDGVAKTSNRTLTEGVNVLTVTETDAAGNTSSKTFSVTLDTVAPIVQITSSAVSNVSNYVLIWTEDAVQKSRSVTLSEGDNLLTVTATDLAGNQTVVNYSVRYQTENPSVEYANVCPDYASNSIPACAFLNNEAVDPVGFTGINHRNADNYHNNPPPSSPLPWWATGIKNDEAPTRGLQLEGRSGYVTVVNASIAYGPGPGTDIMNVAMKSQMSAEALFKAFTDPGSPMMGFYPGWVSWSSFSYETALGAWPYTASTKGNSGSEVELFQAYIATLGSFRKDVFNYLKETGNLFTVTSMIEKYVSGGGTEDGYLSGKAHQSFRDTAYKDLTLAMSKMANSLTLETLPPISRIKMTSSQSFQNGVDYFDPNGWDAESGNTVIKNRDDTIFDTPMAIATRFDEFVSTKVFELDAGDSFSISGVPIMEYKWTVLKGDAAKVRMTPLNASGSKVRVEIDFHSPVPDPWNKNMPDPLLTIGVFAKDVAGRISSPAYFSSLTPVDQKRTYENGKIKEVVYTDVGPILDDWIGAPKGWVKDQYFYDTKGNALGWDRTYKDGKVESYDRFGNLVTAWSDAKNRVPSTTTNVQYSLKLLSGRNYLVSGLPTYTTIDPATRQKVIRTVAGISLAVPQPPPLVVKQKALVLNYISNGMARKKQFTLVEGVNRISVSDDTGVSGEKVTLTYLVTLDTTVPAVEMLSAASVKTDRYALTYKVDGDIRTEIVRLTPGLNKIKRKYFDLAGNEIEKIFEINYTP